MIFSTNNISLGDLNSVLFGFSFFFFFFFLLGFLVIDKELLEAN